MLSQRVDLRHACVRRSGGNRATLLANYAMVLQMLATHQVWDHFATVLVRGVAVSEAEDQDGDDDEGGGAADAAVVAPLQ